MAKHTVYMEGGSIINAFTGCAIERPTVLVSKNGDIIHAWGNFESVDAKFRKYVAAYSQTGLAKELDGLMLVELSEFGITSEMACYVIRRMSEYTATDFAARFCEAVLGPDPIGWLKEEKKKFPIDLTERNRKER